MTVMPAARSQPETLSSEGGTPFGTGEPFWDLVHDQRHRIGQTS